MIRGLALEARFKVQAGLTYFKGRWRAFPSCNTMQVPLYSEATTRPATERHRKTHGAVPDSALGTFVFSLEVPAARRTGNECEHGFCPLLGCRRSDDGSELES